MKELSGRTVFAIRRAALAVGVIIALGSAVSSCASHAGPLEPVSIEEAKSGIGFSIKPGPAWESVAWYFIVPVTKTPQLAVWLEAEDGRFLKTLYVSGKAATGSWLAAPKKGRPEALPAWEAARRSASELIASGQSGPKGTVAADAVSGPTPEAASAIGMAGIDLSDGAGTIRIRLEANKSYDYNEAWPEASSGVDGQPSLVWEALLQANGVVRALRPVGHGSIESGFVPGLEGFTSALDIIAGAEAWWKP